MDPALQAIIGAIAGVAALGAVDKKITERLVKWFAFIKGDLISLASVVVGWGLAFLFPGINPADAINTAVGSPIADLPNWATRLIVGILVAIAAGAFADREEAKTGAVIVPGEGQVVARSAPFDEGYNPGDPGYDEWLKTRPTV